MRNDERKIQNAKWIYSNCLDGILSLIMIKFCTSINHFNRVQDKWDDRWIGGKKGGKNKKPLQNLTSQGLYVVPPGIEPGTHGFSVRCSTIWAKVPAKKINEILLWLIFYQLGCKYKLIHTLKKKSSGLFWTP